MREMVCGEEISILELPHGNKCWGIILPFEGQVNKDGVAVFKQRDAKEAGHLLHVNRTLGRYVEKWGNRVFYLGTFQNPSKGIIRFFSFPIKNGGGSTELTILAKSCEDLAALCKRYRVSKCLLPMLAEDLGIDSFIHCVKPILELLLSDDFIMIHRKGDFDDTI